MTSKFSTIFIFILSLCIIFPALLSASELDKDYTLIYQFTTDKGVKVAYPVRNGYFWGKLGLKEKVFFLDGMNDGKQLLFLKVQENSSSDNVIGAVIDSLLELGERTGFGLPELSQQIDMFYQDSANRKIPVIEAFRYIKKRIKGATPQDLNNLAANLRKEYNSK